MSVQGKATATANQSMLQAIEVKRGSNELNVPSIPDRSFEQSMPQSQLWFVNQNTTAVPHVSRTQAVQRRPAAGTILPAVRRSKFADISSSKEYSIARRTNKFTKDPMRRSMVQAKDEENSRSRNYLNPQAQSHSVSGPEISNDVNGRSID